MTAELDRLETYATENVSVVKAHTTDGNVGVGQIAHYNADISATVFHRHIAPHALGRDADDIEALVTDVLKANNAFPWSYVCRALAGLDTALWDLKGKQHGEPVVSLLGGSPTALDAYGSSMSREITPEDEAERIVRLAETDGYDAFKIRVGGWESVGDDEDAWPGRSESVVETVREAVGEDVELFVDANSAYSPETAIELGEELLLPNDIGFFEEPCPWWKLDQTAEVNASLDMTVAAGERENDLWRWRQMVEMDAVDLVQPDVCYIGGLSRAVRAAEIAADAGLPCIPHSSSHTLVTVFSLHLIGALEEPGGYVEFSIEDHWADDFLESPLVVDDGTVRIPSGPGWGVDVSDDWFHRTAYEVSEA